MLGTIVDILIQFVIGGIAMFVIGFTMPKFFVYGCLGVGLFWASAPMIPGTTRAQVESILLAIGNIWTFLPRVIYGFIGEMGAEYGLLGIALAVIIGLVFTVPYLYGCYYGITCWPELRIIL